ncbi:MAG: family transporter [Herbaspirillum sp.]|jgi:drug/metabolite transporter (DMT)-like permease|nr:family transporter [Herbaspirillum sp.]
MNHEIRGMWYGFIGVAIFSLTLPFTRMAVQELNPLFVGFGRGAAAGVGSLFLLWYMKAPLPTKAQWRRLAVTAAGVVIGFPVFSSLAMQSVPASHGAIVLGALPLATALVGALRCGERPSPWFWLAALTGSGLVIGFALYEGGGSFHAADLALFAAVALAAVGYAEGGRLAQAMGGPQVIAWALVLCLPVLLPLTLWLGWSSGAVATASARGWLGFAYVSLFSMFIGFFFWYKGLALGGIARVAQMQLLQPFMTLLGAALLIGDRLEISNLLFAAAVIAVVALGRRAGVRRGGGLAAPASRPLAAEPEPKAFR